MGQMMLDEKGEIEWGRAPGFGLGLRFRVASTGAASAAAPAGAVDIIAPQHSRTPGRRRLAGGHLQPRHAALLRRHPELSSSNRPPGIRRSASPRSSSSTNRARRGKIPVGNLRTVRVDLPPGLSVNPQATPQCELVGGESPDARLPVRHAGRRQRTSRRPALADRLAVPFRPFAVYNLVPDRANRPASASACSATTSSSKPTSPGTSDYHEYFTIHVARRAAAGRSNWRRSSNNRLVFDGNGRLPANGTFITTPSTCFNPDEAAPSQHIYSTYLPTPGTCLRGRIHATPTFPAGFSRLRSVESPLPPRRD